MINSTDAQRFYAGLQNLGLLGQYVKILETERAAAVKTLLYAPGPDEAARGEARAYDQLLLEVRKHVK